MTTRLLAFVGLLVAVAAILWGAGELHRANCIDAKRANCSVLPWDNGDETWDSRDNGWGGGGGRG